ncbi:MAG: PEP/pyruvate-binding domain-containing protein [archaeon]|nr:PEP/pyruvate-binding domain-containing protein [archaeon]
MAMAFCLVFLALRFTSLVQWLVAVFGCQTRRAHLPSPREEPPVSLPAVDPQHPEAMWRRAPPQGQPSQGAAEALAVPFSQVALFGDPLHLAGGKAVNLARLAAFGYPVPQGFCVTTTAFRAFLTASEKRINEQLKVEHGNGNEENGDGEKTASSLRTIDDCFTALESLDGATVSDAPRVAGRLRELLKVQPVPRDVEAAVRVQLQQAGLDKRYAVRSSATAEDLPGASFAGQHDTFLNVGGADDIVEAVRDCWLSLYTDRAVAYRCCKGFGHRSVLLAVVVQEMVDPHSSGILFTADPVTGHRNVLSIDAGYGLGEGLVSGIVDGDLYKIDKLQHRLLSIRLGTKELAIRSLFDASSTSSLSSSSSCSTSTTYHQILDDEMRASQVLSLQELAELTHIATAIETSFASPQDIEWAICHSPPRLYILQTRPITTLFPIPLPSSDAPHRSRHFEPSHRLFVSFGHMQMMTQPMTPLGRDVWKLMTSVLLPPCDPCSDLRHPFLRDAGSRLFVDPSPLLQIPFFRPRVLRFLARVYPTIPAIISAHIARHPLHDRPIGSVFTASFLARAGGIFISAVTLVLKRLLWADLSHTPVEDMRRVSREMLDGYDEAVSRCQLLSESIAVTQRYLQLRIMPTLSPVSFPSVSSALMAESLLKLLLAGDADAQDDIARLSRGLDGNITTQMDLEIADLADILRPESPSLIRLRGLALGAAAPSSPAEASFVRAFHDFLQRYGARAAGEIDIGRPRWREDPMLVVSTVFGNLSSGDTGSNSHRVRTAGHQEEALEAITALEARARARFPRAVGALVGRFTRRLALVTRCGFALREHPKFAVVSVLDRVRTRVLAAGQWLADAGLIEDPCDCFHLHFSELTMLVRQHEQQRHDSQGHWKALISQRRQAFATDGSRNPPLVMTSHGEVLQEPAPENLPPPNALAGVAASAGVVEAVATVIDDPATQVLPAGTILVCTFTDPAWTPLFVHAAGLITEVGGLMTHGSVIAREYGLPAVVSVPRATSRIKTGDRLRLDGTQGTIQILSSD